MSITNDDVVESDNRKVSQLYKAIKNRVDIKYIERILQVDGDINSEFPTKVNNNLLHLAYSENNIKLFRLLLNYNADFTAKNGEGFTVVHRVILGKRYNFEVHRNKYQNSYVDSILSAHLTYKNPFNPIYLDNGLSHFHVACMSDNVEVVEFFLKHGISIEQSINNNSSIFGGYTPLHFAARYSCLKTAEILLKYGANIHSREANGLTPLSILIDRKINGSEDSNNKIIKLLLEHDIISNRNYKSSDKFHLSNLHAACVLESTTILERILEKPMDVNLRINVDSEIFSGYTPLHFAALFTAKAFELLANKGGDVTLKNAENTTPFELYLQRQSLENVQLLISSKREWADIVLSDKRTRLLDLVFAMTSVDRLGLFLADNELTVELSVPEDSKLWPGCTILHLAVMFSETNDSEDMDRIEELLTRGFEITRRDSEGSTPLHLAFYLGKRRVVECLLKHHFTNENPSDSNNLSHLHIACAARNEIAVERFLSNENIDVNVPVDSTFKWSVAFNSQGRPRSFFIIPGVTPLHVNVASGNLRITKMLLNRDADVYAKDSNGFTPIHRLFTSRALHFYENLDELLFNIDDLKESVANCGLTHLHVACSLNNLRAVEKLVDSGTNIDARLHVGKIEERMNVYKIDDPYGADLSLSFLSRYDGFTALNFAIQRNYHLLRNYLMENDADLFAESISEMPIYKILHYNSDVLIPILMRNVDWQIRLKEKFGLTMLHIACQAAKPEIIEEILNSGENANVQVKVDSPIWAGCTPLHLAVNSVVRSSSEDNEELKKMIRLLLDNEADLTIMNCEGQTPLHAIDVEKNRSFDSSYTNLLLDTVKDFSVNPTNPQGISFFHIACIKKDFNKVEKYLKNGVDVNQSVNNYSDRFSGCSPLHMTAGYRCKSFVDVDSQLKTVDLLLQYGADVNVKDCYDNTPLHAAAEKGLSREILFDMIIRKGANVHAENVFGETPLEILAKSGNSTWAETNCLLQYGCHVNSYNPITMEGYVPKFFISPENRKERDLANVIVQKLINSDYVTEVDNEGRTFLHNLVSVGSLDKKGSWHRDDLIERIVKRGCKINCRDVRGKTALHAAALFKNSLGVRTLLINGADVNELDEEDKTAFSYIFEENSCSNISEYLVELFVVHIHKMELCNLYVNEINRQLKIQAMKDYDLESTTNRFNNIVEKTKNVNIGSSPFTLYDFCFNAKIIYSNMSYNERQEIDKFYENNKDNIRQLDYMLILKYKIATEKLRLIESAIISFSDLIKDQLPDLCCRVILNFLTNADLENVIASIT